METRNCKVTERARPEVKGSRSVHYQEEAVVGGSSVDVVQYLGSIGAMKASEIYKGEGGLHGGYFLQVGAVVDGSYELGRNQAGSSVHKICNKDRHRGNC